MYFLVRTLGSAATIGLFLTKGNQCGHTTVSNRGFLGDFLNFYLCTLFNTASSAAPVSEEAGIEPTTVATSALASEALATRLHLIHTVSSHFRKDAICAKFRGEIETKSFFQIIWSCENI